MTERLPLEKTNGFDDLDMQFKDLHSATAFKKSQGKKHTYLKYHVQ
jgi:hypothetical protein